MKNYLGAIILVLCFKGWQLLVKLIFWLHFENVLFAKIEDGEISKYWLRSNADMDFYFYIKGTHLVKVEGKHNKHIAGSIEEER